MGLNYRMITIPHDLSTCPDMFSLHDANLLVGTFSPKSVAGQGLVQTESETIDSPAAEGVDWPAPHQRQCRLCPSMPSCWQVTCLINAMPLSAQQRRGLQPSAPGSRCLTMMMISCFSRPCSSPGWPGAFNHIPKHPWSRCHKQSNTHLRDPLTQAPLLRWQVEVKYDGQALFFHYRGCLRSLLHSLPVPSIK